VSANTLAAGTIEALAERSAARRANCRLEISLFLGSFIVPSPNKPKIQLNSNVSRGY
jgi:hypothetical protein